MFLRIGENSASSQRKDPSEESDSDTGEPSSPEPRRHTSAGTGRVTGASVIVNESQDPAKTAERPVRTGSGLKRGGKNNPERYLHRILH